MSCLYHLHLSMPQTPRCWVTLLIFLLSHLLATSCAPPSQPEEDGYTDTSDVHDASGDSEPFADVSDVSFEGPDAKDSDADEPPRDQELPRPDESTWVCDSDGTPITYSPIEEPFRLPDSGIEYEPKTAQGLKDEYGASGANSVITRSPSPRHALYAPTVDAFAASEGDDVTLHIAMWKPGGPFEDAHLTGTVLREYKPVQATYEIWDDDRQSIMYSTKDAGINTPVDSEVVLVDITIPAGEFDDTGAHELAVFLQIGSPGTTHIALGWRTFVFYGGYSRFPHPCFERTNNSETTDEEHAVLETLFHSTSSHIYPRDETGEEIKRVHKVAPGETVTVEYFKTTKWTNVAQPSVLQPLLAGQPVGEPVYLYPPIKDAAGLLTNFRKDLEIEMPQEPGLYPVAIAGFDDAHLLMLDHRRNLYLGVGNGDLDSSTNTLWYEVVEEQ